MESAEQHSIKRFSIFGFFLILLGFGLILSKLQLVHYGWGMILWICLGIGGLSAVIQAFLTRRRAVVFWGSLLFFISVLVLVQRWMLFDVAPWDAPAAVSLAIGLSFLMMFFYDPRRLGVLVPVLLFCGYGVLYYLWWWDVIDMFELKRSLKLYWPFLIILWGVTLLIPRRAQSD